jgi:hypothetical protein
MIWARESTNADPYWDGKRVLVICARGNSRSVALGWILKDHLRADALACGATAQSSETLTMLCAWADLIIIVDAKLVGGVPPEYLPKTRVWPVGEDRYFRGFDDRLLSQYSAYLDRYMREVTL